MRRLRASLIVVAVKLIFLITNLIGILEVEDIKNKCPNECRKQTILAKVTCSFHRMGAGYLYMKKEFIRSQKTVKGEDLDSYSGTLMQ